MVASCPKFHFCSQMSFKVETCRQQTSPSGNHLPTHLPASLFGLARASMAAPKARPGLYF